MLLHIQTVSMLSNRNGMTLSNLVSTFAPCMISQTTVIAPPPPPPPFKNTQVSEHRRLSSLDDSDIQYSETHDDSFSLSDNESQDSVGILINTSTPAKPKRNPSYLCKISF